MVNNYTMQLQQFLAPQTGGADFSKNFGLADMLANDAALEQKNVRGMLQSGNYGVQDYARIAEAAPNAANMLTNLLKKPLREAQTQGQQIQNQAGALKNEMSKQEIIGQSVLDLERIITQSRNEEEKQAGYQAYMSRLKALGIADDDDPDVLTPQHEQTVLNTANFYRRQVQPSFEKLGAGERLYQVGADGGASLVAEGAEKPRDFGFGDYMTAPEGVRQQYDRYKGRDQTEIIYGENGQPIVVRGRGGDVGALTSSNTTKAQAATMESAAQIQSLIDIKKAYKPEFLTYGSQAENAVTSTGEKLGISLSPEQKQDLREKRVFGSRVKQAFNTYKKLITGAAAGEREIKDLEESFLNSNLSPTQFEAQLDDLIYQSALAVKLNQKFLQKGVSPKQRQDLIKEQTLNVPQEPMARAKALRAAGFSSDEARQILFGRKI